jgi:hypothetical protein
VTSIVAICSRLSQRSADSQPRASCGAPVILFRIFLLSQSGGFEIHLHLGWITKYRRPALQGEVAKRVRDLVRDICGQHDVAIMKGHVSKDHVHLLISLPPQVTISRLM